MKPFPSELTAECPDQKVYSSAWTAPALAEPAPWCLLVCARRARGSAGAHGFGKEIASAARGMRAISHRKA